MGKKCMNREKNSMSYLIPAQNIISDICCPDFSYKWKYMETSTEGSTRSINLAYLFNFVQEIVLALYGKYVVFVLH